jgi:hypothetical protein
MLPQTYDLEITIQGVVSCHQQKPWATIFQYANCCELFYMGALYHPEEVPLKKSSQEMIMPLF